MILQNQKTIKQIEKNKAFCTKNLFYLIARKHPHQCQARCQHERSKISKVLQTKCVSRMRKGIKKYHRNYMYTFLLHFSPHSGTLHIELCDKTKFNAKCKILKTVIFAIDLAQDMNLIVNLISSIWLNKS